MEWDIGREGRKWTRAEVEAKYHAPCPGKIEPIKGRMFWTDGQRLNMLALLLENVGIEAAVRLGDPALWKQAIADRLNARDGVSANPDQGDPRPTTEQGCSPATPHA